jgi:hypothetical protein
LVTGKPKKPMINVNLVMGKPKKPRINEKLRVDEDNPLASIEAN